MKILFIIKFLVGFEQLNNKQKIYQEVIVKSIISDTECIIENKKNIFKEGVNLNFKFIPKLSHKQMFETVWSNLAENKTIGELKNNNDVIYY